MGAAGGMAVEEGAVAVYEGRIPLQNSRGCEKPTDGITPIET